LTLTFIRAINTNVLNAMKKRSTTPPASSIKRVATKSALVAAAVFMTLQPVMPTAVSADQFDAQIRALQAQVDSYQQQASNLAQQADTLANKLAELTAQTNALQAQVNASQAQYDQLTQQIADAQDKLVKQQGLLGSTLAKLYADSSTSPLEMLASSKSIGDYLDKQAYHTTIRNQVLSAIKTIKALKAELETKQVQVKQVLADLTSQRDQAAAIQQQQADLLAETQGQEAAYQSLIGQNNAQISSLRAQQRAANAALGGSVVAGDPSHGGYPNKWANAPQDSTYDNWGMYNRECVSYTAWKVFQTYGHMPYWGGRGNANQWPGSAAQDGIPTGSTPKVGSVAISMSGPYGHAMWVEAVNGSQIYVSQYNYYYGGWGNYSEMWVNGNGLTYIYFS